jgi:hypothetical protein
VFFRSISKIVINIKTSRTHKKELRAKKRQMMKIALEEKMNELEKLLYEELLKKIKYGDEKCGEDCVIEVAHHGEVNSDEFYQIEIQYMMEGNNIRVMGSIDDGTKGMGILFPTEFNLSFIMTPEGKLL